MPPLTPRPFVFALILASVLVGLAPSVGAATVTQNFEGFADFSKPCTSGPTPPCTATGYTYTETGSGSRYVVSTPSPLTGKSLYTLGTMNSDFQTGGTFCTGSVSFTVSIHVAGGGRGAVSSYWAGVPVTIASYDTGGGAPTDYIRFSISFTASGGNAFANLDYAGHTTSPTATLSGGSSSIQLTTGGTVGAEILSDHQYGFTVSCPSIAGGVLVLSSSEAASLGFTAQAQVTVPSYQTPATHFGIKALTSGANYYDNLSMTANIVGGSTPSAGGNIFCSDPAVSNFGGDPNADFGYNYAEDVAEKSGDDLIQQPSFLGGSDYFEFQGDYTDFAYLGKGFTQDKALNTTFGIEAATEGGNSIFRAVYSFVPGTPSSTTKGDGGYPIGTNSFGAYVEAYFIQFGNSWRIIINEQHAGTRTQLMGSAFAENVKDRHEFAFKIDTRTATNSATIYDENGAVLISRFLPSFFTEGTAYSQWFVGYGTAVVSNDYTALTEPRAGFSRSTCIDSLTGAGVVTGSSGQQIIPGNGGGGGGTTTAAGGLFLVNAANVPEGFTASGFQMFLGVLLVAGIAAGMYFIGRSPGMGVGGGALGFILAFSFGLFPLWLILVLVVAAVAVIFLRMRGAF